MKKLDIPAQLLLYRAASAADTGFPNATETAIAKAYCTAAAAALRQKNAGSSWLEVELPALKNIK